MSVRVRQCTYIYQHAYRDRQPGSRCTNAAVNRDRTTCDLHREPHRVTANIDPMFPRIYTGLEEQTWITEARLRTDPELNVRGVCMICGQLWEQAQLIAIAERDLLKAKEILSADPLLETIPRQYFDYRQGYQRLSGLILDRRGFFRAEELTTGSDFLGRSCLGCWKWICQAKMPPFALANHLWTGVGEVEELRGLTWVEEKLIARTHVSIQLQKCRLRRNYSWDQFYPQSRLKGHITTYPMNPTIALQTLPLPLDRISEVIKVVFLTRREISLREASSLSFFLVRKEKVFTALQWLRLNNPLYANVELDEDALNALPLHGLPKQVYDTITFSNRLTEDIMGHSRYDESDDLGKDNNICSFIDVRGRRC